LRKLCAATAALGVIVGSLGAAVAAPDPRYFASPNAELVAHVVLNYDASGGRVVGDRFYVTTTRDLRIYDISNPLLPEVLGTLPLVQEPQYAEEDLDTNGRIALVESLGTFNVVDVSRPTVPRIAATLDVADYHTITCVLDCSYAYGSNGKVVDLRNPDDPREVGDWRQGTPLQGDSAHDVTEVAPGLIVTSSQPILYLDARADPVHPTLVAVGRNDDRRFIHANVWPNGGTDRFLLVGGETLGPRCDTATSGAFMVWDTAQLDATGEFTMLDDYRVSHGAPTDGWWPYGQFCAHWFQPHPSFDDGGLVAMAWYESGVRFLDVSAEGQITEVGYVIPVGSVASAAYWVTDEILYVVDYFRGLDIVRFKR
jgi:hypothetical protein